jgi:hypothetical protein
MSETMQSVIRVDKAPMPRVTRTDEGYLRGEAIVTRTGVFTYMNADGSKRRELRHPDDIIQDDSIASMRQIPVTVDHPAALVNADTAQELSVGMTGENVRADGGHIIAPFTITHKTGIDAVTAGRRELSLGYRLDLVEEQGEYNGERYDYRQTNVRYNHLALVAQARAGNAARINLDGASVLIATSDEKDIPMADKMTAVNLDGISYDAAPEVAKALEKAIARADTAETEREDAKRSRADMEKEYDSLKGKMDALKEEMDAMKGENKDAAIAEAAKARVSLLTKAGKVIEADKHMDASDRDIMVEVIKAKSANFDAEGKSDDYIVARFDAVMEAVEAEGQGIKKQAAKVGARVDSSEPEKDHRKDAEDSIVNMWKPKQKGAA